jgi:hypothetical protein
LKTLRLLQPVFSAKLDNFYMNTMLIPLSLEPVISIPI